jgi:hypothetical protein
MLSGDDLSTLMASSVPPQHLMRPVHSAGRGRACLFHWQEIRLCCRMRCTHHDSRVTKDAAARYQYCMHYGYYGARRLPWHCR